MICLWYDDDDDDDDDKSRSMRYWAVQRYWTCVQNFGWNLIQVIQPTRCNSSTRLLLDVYVWLNMFQPWGPPNPYTVGTGSFLGVKWPGRGAHHPPPPSAEVKERVELYTYFPFGPSWIFTGGLSPFLLTYFFCYYNFFLHPPCPKPVDQKLYFGLKWRTGQW
jgi:hypothetical protein